MHSAVLSAIASGFTSGGGASVNGFWAVADSTQSLAGFNNVVPLIFGDKRLDGLGNYNSSTGVYQSKKTSGTIFLSAGIETSGGSASAPGSIGIQQSTDGSTWFWIAYESDYWNEAHQIGVQADLAEGSYFRCYHQVNTSTTLTMNANEKSFFSGYEVAL